MRDPAVCHRSTPYNPALFALLSGRPLPLGCFQRPPCGYVYSNREYTPKGLLIFLGCQGFLDGRIIIIYSGDQDLRLGFSHFSAQYSNFRFSSGVIRMILLIVLLFTAAPFLYIQICIYIIPTCYRSGHPPTSLGNGPVGTA